MANIKQNATLARRDHLALELALTGNRGVGERPESMRQHVARPKATEDGLVVRRGLINVGHDRQARFVSYLERDFERHDAGCGARIFADPDLDADDHVTVRLRNLDRLSR